jgi:hypothetical protein
VRGFLKSFIFCAITNNGTYCKELAGEFTKVPKLNCENNLFHNVQLTDWRCNNISIGSFFLRRSYKIIENNEHNEIAILRKNSLAHGMSCDTLCNATCLPFPEIPLRKDHFCSFESFDLFSTLTIEVDLVRMRLQWS